MIARQMRFGLRLQRFELIALGGIIGLGAAALFVGVAQLAGVAPPLDCLDWDGTTPQPQGCPEAMSAFQAVASTYYPISTPLMLLPWAAAVLLGVPIVARELERGTARLAWSLTASRVRWFTVRTIPIMAVLAVIAYVAGVAIDQWLTAVRPEMDLTNSFEYRGVRGILIASRALLVFAIAVLAGAVLGRVLPALIVAAVVGSVAITGVNQVHEQILDGEAAWFEGESASGDHYVDTGFRLPDGSIVSQDGCYDGTDILACYDAEGNPRYPAMRLVVPGERYRFAEMREAAALAVATVIPLVLAAIVVRRRRPE